jgi:hypothetical protein
VRIQKPVTNDCKAGCMEELRLNLKDMEKSKDEDHLRFSFTIFKTGDL